MALLHKKGGSMYTGDVARRLARETNEYGARVVADSKGRFFQAEIRDRYPYNKLDS